MVRVDPTAVAFAAFAALTIGSAAVVAFARNVVHSAVGLLGTFGGVAALYVLLAADFLAAVQLLVYVGGTLILILFAVMLTARIDRVAASNMPRPRRRAVLLLLLFFAALVLVAKDAAWSTQPAVFVPTTAKLGHAFLGPYVLPFELVSLLLLVALVGAVVLARRAVKPGADVDGGAP